LAYAALKYSRHAPFSFTAKLYRKPDIKARKTVSIRIRRTTLDSQQKEKMEAKSLTS
jgi:hypothetical protein